MTKRPWALSPALVAALLAGTVVYAVIAEAIGFDGLAPRMPDARILPHRLWQILFLWVIGCVAAGWIQVLRKRRPPRNATIWPLVYITLGIAVLLAAFGAWETYEEYLEDVNRRWFTGWGSVERQLAAASVLLPLIAGAVAALVIGVQSLAWRRPTAPGVCSLCNYDLTGNVSGACPECGTPIVSDQDIPRWFFQRRFRLLPELAFFSNAKLRHEAWKRARKAQSRNAWSGALAVVVVTTTVCMFALEGPAWLDKYWWILFFVFGPLFLVEFVAWHRRM